MSENYKEMWKNLGLDLDQHYALLEVLGKVYEDIYLAQNNSLESMAYFNSKGQGINLHL